MSLQTLSLSFPIAALPALSLHPLLPLQEVRTKGRSCGPLLLVRGSDDQGSDGCCEQPGQSKELTSSVDLTDAVPATCGITGTGERPAGLTYVTHVHHPFLLHAS